MASDKIRRLLRPTGGITVGSLTIGTSGQITHSGSVALSGSTVLSGSVQVNSVGTQIHRVLYGTTTVTAISCGAASSGSANMTIADLAVGDAVFVTPGSMAACVIYTGACAEAVSRLNLRFYNAGSAATADTPLTVSYLIFG